MANKAHNCPVYKRCGGCQLQNMDYKSQLSYKQAKVIGLLGKFCHVDEIVGMEHPYHYRNKVQAAFGKDGRGIISGVYQSSSHRIVPIDSCLIEDEKADAVIVTVRRLAASFKLSIFNEKTLKGFLRHVLVKRSFTTGQLMVVLVTGTPVFPSKNNFIEALLKEHPEITTIVQNINDRFTALVLGKKNIVLYGEGRIEDELMGCRFRISPASFYQVNPVQTEKLYSLAMKYLDLRGKETVLDAYCGTGTIGILAAKSGAGKVVGVEINADAVSDARENAALNGVENIEFVCADASDYIRTLALKKTRLDSVIMDPPRAGSTVQFMNAVIKLAPERVVYVSCNPETLARDLLHFSKNGYRVRKITPVDMFPHTNHVETVALLSRKKPDDVIHIDLELDKLDITSAESKATYQEIKDYVLENFGLKVSALYISQVKRKLGIEVVESYNKAKSNNSKVPNCPKEKEDAIVAALKHFGMVK